MANPKESPNSPGGKKPECMNMVSVETETLKNELNHLYDAMRECTKGGSPTPGLFEYLWDLKELALIEGRESVQVPTKWLDELHAIEDEFVTR
jgi:hypothetical protein